MEEENEEEKQPLNDVEANRMNPNADETDTENEIEAENDEQAEDVDEEQELVEQIDDGGNNVQVN